MSPSRSSYLTLRSRDIDTGRLKIWRHISASQCASLPPKAVVPLLLSWRPVDEPNQEDSLLLEYSVTLYHPFQSLARLHVVRYLIFVDPLSMFTVPIWHHL